MSKNILAFVILLAMASSSVSHEQGDISPTARAGLDSRELARLNRQFQHQLNTIQREFNLPGITAAINLEDGYVSEFAAGLADREMGLVMQPHMLMLPASIGKTYVGALLSQLIEEKVISLYDPLSKWLGDRSWFARLPNAYDIKIFHLANHTAGLHSHFTTPKFRRFMENLIASGDMATATWSPETSISFLLDEKPLSRPGEKSNYTDTGFLLLGLVIEVATGDTYYNQWEKRLLIPLDLKETLRLDRREIPNLAQGYGRKRDVNDPSSLRSPRLAVENGVMAYNPSWEWTGGGLVSTSADLARWFFGLFTSNIAGVGYIDRIHTNMTQLPTDVADPAKAYGMGMTLRSAEFGCMYYHRGRMPNYLSNAYYFVDSGRSLAFMINSNDPEIVSEDKRFQVWKSLAGALHGNGGDPARVAASFEDLQERCRLKQQKLP